MSGLPGAWPGSNGAAIPGSVTCGTGAARWAGRPTRLVRPSPGRGVRIPRRLVLLPIPVGPAVGHGRSCGEVAAPMAIPQASVRDLTRNDCGTIHRRSTAAAQLRAGDRGSRLGATGCTERPSTAPNCTRRPATAPTPACGFSSPQVRVGAASGFTPERSWLTYPMSWPLANPIGAKMHAGAKETMRSRSSTVRLWNGELRNTLTQYEASMSARPRFNQGPSLTTPSGTPIAIPVPLSTTAITRTAVRASAVEPSA
jgi:hypothetical protein